MVDEVGPYREAMRLASVPRPTPAADQAVVRVLSCGLAFPDVLMVEGKHMFKKDPGHTPGQEICGVVTRVSVRSRACLPARWPTHPRLCRLARTCMTYV